MRITEVKDWGEDKSPKYEWMDAKHLPEHINHGGSRLLCKFSQKVSDGNTYVGYACFEIKLNQDGYSFTITDNFTKKEIDVTILNFMVFEYCEKVGNETVLN